jgi:hypothetical protein
MVLVGLAASAAALAVAPMVTPGHWNRDAHVGCLQPGHAV